MNKPVLELLELTENQSRQYIDAQALMRAQGEALEDAAQVRGSMIWRELRGVRYLIRTSAASAQKTIGPDGTETQAIYDRFMERKQAATARVKSLALRLEEQRKLNRLYGVGRAPNVIVNVLGALQKAGISSQFLSGVRHPRPQECLLRGQASNASPATFFRSLILVNSRWRR